MNFYEIAVHRAEQLRHDQLAIEKKLKNAPKGRLHCYTNKKSGKIYYKWYWSQPIGLGEQSAFHPAQKSQRKQKRHYLPKKDKALASALAVKKIDRSRLMLINNELTFLEALLKRHHPEQESLAEKLVTSLNSPYIQELLPDDMRPFPTLQDELLAWMQEDYPQNPYFPENRKVSTIAGIQVRSKSEMLIVTLLVFFKIPFRYECEIDLGGHTFYPDFTIRHPVTGEYYYWEHCGMIDDPDYFQKFQNKMRLYVRSGILPDQNLILTFESEDHPADPNIVVDKIREFFLCDGVNDSYDLNSITGII